MKTPVNRLVLIAAGAIALGSAAYGQNSTLEAKIPFAFRTASATLPAGTYTFTQDARSGMTMLRLWNSENNRGVFAAARNVDIYHQHEKPAILFVCGVESCTLNEIRTSAGISTYAKPRGRENLAETASVVSVPLLAHNGQ